MVANPPIQRRMVDIWTVPSRLVSHPNMEFAKMTALPPPSQPKRPTRFHADEAFSSHSRDIIPRLRFRSHSMASSSSPARLLNSLPHPPSWRNSATNPSSSSRISLLNCANLTNSVPNSSSPSSVCGRFHFAGRSSRIGGGFGVAIRSGSGNCGGVSAGVERRGSVRVEFAGLRKMTSTEGLQKRIRDPQLAASEASGTVEKTRNYVRSQITKPGVKSLIAFVGVPLLLGSVDAMFNSPASQWFSDLKKPWWEPPGPIFGGMWSVLYPLMGLASWLVWAEGGFHKQGMPLTLYVVQLVLNLLWPMFFFGWKKLGLALVDILILDGVLAATINSFQSVNHVAANLLKPYLAWVLFATVLNFNLWLNNRGGSAQPAQ